MDGMALGWIWVASSALMCALLYCHFRWAEIDPHNPLGRPGPIATVVKSFLVMLAILIAVSFMHSSREIEAALVGSFAFGMVAAPAFSTPLVLRHDEEADKVTRILESLRAAAGGSLAKVILVFIVSAIVEAVSGIESTYWVVAFLACIFSFSKIGVVLAMSGPASDLHSDYVKSGLAKKIVPVALTGILSLAIWYPLAIPMFETIPALDLRSLVVSVALWLGLTLGAVDR